MCSAKDSSAAHAYKETGRIYSTYPRDPTVMTALESYVVSRRALEADHS